MNGYPRKSTNCLRGSRANPGGKWDDVPKRLITFGWDFIKETVSTTTSRRWKLPRLVGLWPYRPAGASSRVGSRGRRPANRPTSTAEPIDALRDDALMTHVDLGQGSASESGTASVKARPLAKEAFGGLGRGAGAETRKPRYLYRVGAVRDVLREAVASSPAAK